MTRFSSESIRLVLEDRLRSGEWLPGAQIVESDLVREFQVSRTPVRDALLQLSALGYIRITPRKGIRVVRLSVKDVLALLEMLAHLEGLCAKLATERMTPAQKTAWVRQHNDAKAVALSGDARRYADMNEKFHHALYENCHNAFLVEQIRQIRNRTAAYRLKRFENSSGLRQSWEGHEKIVAALMAEAPEAAYAAACEHITMGGKEFAELVSRLPNDIFEDNVAVSAALAASGGAVRSLPFWEAPRAPLPTPARRGAARPISRTAQETKK